MCGPDSPAKTTGISEIKALIETGGKNVLSQNREKQPHAFCNVRIANKKSGPGETYRIIFQLKDNEDRQKEDPKLRMC
jgi:hypothetical protein